MITLVILYTRNLHNTMESFYKKRVTQNGILGFKDSVSVQYDDVPRHLIFINNYQILKWYKYKCTYLWCLIFPIRQWLKSIILKKKKPHVFVTEIKNVSQVKDVKWPPHSNTTNWNTTTFNSNVKETWRARENISSAYFFFYYYCGREMWFSSLVFIVTMSVRKQGRKQTSLTKGLGFSCLSPRLAFVHMAGKMAGSCKASLVRGWQSTVTKGVQSGIFSSPFIPSHLETKWGSTPHCMLTHNQAGSAFKSRGSEYEENNHQINVKPPAAVEDYIKHWRIT